MLAHRFMPIARHGAGRVAQRGHGGGRVIFGFKKENHRGVFFSPGRADHARGYGFGFTQKRRQFAAGDFGVLGVGFAVSFIVALFSIKFLLNFIKKHTFLPFGLSDSRGDLVLAGNLVGIAKTGQILYII